MIRRNTSWRSGTMPALIALSFAGSLTACSETEVSETEEYSTGYDDGYAEAQEHYASKMSDAQASIEAARMELSEAQGSAQSAADEASRFSYDDWEYVVTDVQTATDDTVTAVADVDYYLDEADGHLTE